MKSLYKFVLISIVLEEDEEQNEFVLNGEFDLDKLRYYWGTGQSNSEEEMVEELNFQFSKELRKDRTGWIIPEAKAQKINIDSLKKELGQLGLKLELVGNTNLCFYGGCAISSRLYKREFAFEIGYLVADSEEELRRRISKRQDELKTQFRQSSAIYVYEFIPVEYTQLERKLLQIGYKLDSISSSN